MAVLARYPIWLTEDMKRNETRSVPHRPSRREEIVDAAIKVFAMHGFVDSSIAMIAEAAGVAVTAVYYHFASKQELYEAAISSVLRTVDEVVAAVRSDEDPVDRGTLELVIDAVWDWVDENPGPATLMALHTPAATRHAAELRQEFDDLHVRRAFAYLTPQGTKRRKAKPVDNAEATIAVRAMIDFLIVIHPMRLPGGPLAKHKSAALRESVKKVSARLLTN
jgi:AcrR family transcriptional regulator